MKDAINNNSDQKISEIEFTSAVDIALDDLSKAGVDEDLATKTKRGRPTVDGKDRDNFSSRLRSILSEKIEKITLLLVACVLVASMIPIKVFLFGKISTFFSAEPVMTLPAEQESLPSYDNSYVLNVGERIYVAEAHIYARLTSELINYTAQQFVYTLHIEEEQAGLHIKFQLYDDNKGQKRSFENKGGHVTITYLDQSKELRNAEFSVNIEKL